MIEVTYRAGRQTMTLDDLADLVQKAKAAQLPGDSRVSAETYDSSTRVQRMSVVQPMAAEPREAT